MDQLSIEPALPARPTADGFTQTIRLIEKNKRIASARWHARPGQNDGVIQILELSVVTEHARQGIGHRLFEQVVEQSSRFFKQRKSRLRRIWIMVDQKTQMNARAFMNDHGFHHVASIRNLLIDQDALIYSLGMD